MRQAAGVLLLMLAVGAGSPVLAGERGPVCREASVVDVIAREVRALDYYGRVNPRLITEQPTADSRVVRCQVCVQSAPYNIVRYGERPIAQCLARDVDVQILDNGFVVGAIR
jgi:hypothetical protein